MKKIFLLFLVGFSLNSFAQKDNFDQAITKLMYAKKGMLTVENLKDDLSKNLPKDKVAEFTNKMNLLTENFKKTAIQEFKRKYSIADINSIYNEFTSDKINYSDKTNDFFKFFRHLKGQFYGDAKRLYGEFM
ncbi:MAG TPA: hypothetical protein ENK67_04505 [Flavobacteriia bacterium]|nr:hypothetical protein [Flavobacteriia bacterium]